MADVERLGSAPRDVLQALLEAVADAVYLVDHEGRVVFANPAALRLLGYEEDELLGRVSHPTIHHSHWDGSHFPQEECPMLRPRLTGETVRVYGDCFWRKDGSKFRVAYSSAPLAMDGARGAVVVFRDVTSRMNDEQAALAQAIHASRARIVEAADNERRRLGRDLHDGAQQRLVRILLALRLAGRGADEETRALLDQAAADADAAIVELRELGAGIHPQILSNRGIAAAVESLTGPLPLLVESSIPETRFAAGIEAAAYFVIAEGLTNVLKHAQASSAWVTVREDGSRLVVEVGDDGRGGVDIEGGSGLRGLEDRVAALDGTFEVSDGDGTRLRAAFPL